MVADHHGQRTDLRELRRRFPLSLKGASLNRLIGIAHQLGFQTRALRLELDELSQLRLPCILHWDLNHFVVLAKAGKSGVTILDPAFGERKLGKAEVSQHFTGVALELTPGTEFEKQAAPPAIKISQLTGPVRGLWRSLAQILLLSVALQVFVLLAPFFMQWVVDQALVSADRDLLAVLGLGFGLACCAAGRWCSCPPGSACSGWAMCSRMRSGCRWTSLKSATSATWSRAWGRCRRSSAR